AEPGARRAGRPWRRPEVDGGGADVPPAPPRWMLTRGSRPGRLDHRVGDPGPGSTAAGQVKIEVVIRDPTGRGQEGFETGRLADLEGERDASGGVVDQVDMARHGHDAEGAPEDQGVEADGRGHDHGGPGRRQ